MASKSYQIGAAFERKVEDYFTDLGYLITRTPGSHNIYDLIGFNKDEKVIIQCRTNGKLSKAEEKELAAFGVKYGCRVLLAYKSHQQKGRQIEFRNLKENNDVV